LLLHALAIQSVMWATGGRAERSRPREGLGANAIASTEEATATLILIEHPDTGPRAEEAMERVASHGVVLQNLRFTIVTPEPTVDSATDIDEQAEESATASSESSGDRQLQAALFGLYINQIQARVERAWLRPRTPIGAESFECRVQILQSKRGDVAEVQVQRCNGDVRWGLSLVRAIQRASPLPAPPAQSVFAETLQLSFHSAAFVPGGSEEGFEQAAPLVASGNAHEWETKETASSGESGT
jgi:hypothetical protein